MVPILEIERKLLMRFAMLSRQIGSLGGSIIYMLRKIDGYCDKYDRGRMKADLADTIQQLKMICKDLNLDYEEISDLGLARYLERKQEFVTQGKGDLFV